MGEAPSVRAFLIADVRGYTRFTHDHGDQAAARLATRFVDLAEGAVTAYGGSVVELRGDEALAVFDSPTRAVGAAVDMQRRFASAMRADPSLPLRVGIGIDAGEAVRVGEGFRGGALNLAARLCGRARAGEVLVTEGIAHLARSVEGISYMDGGKVAFKNVPHPVHILRARFALDLPPPEPLGSRRRRRWIAVAVAALLHPVWPLG